MHPETESSNLSPVQAARLRLSKRGNLTTRRVDGKPSLSKLDLRLLQMVCYGIERALPHWPDIEPGKPLTPQQAGDMLRMRRRYVRDLTSDPLWHKAMAAEVARIKSGASVKAITKIVETIDRAPIKAADAKVALEAAQAILGDAVGKSAPSINVNVNQSTTVQAGYVIDLAPARTIEGTTSEVGG